MNTGLRYMKLLLLKMIKMVLAMAHWYWVPRGAVFLGVCAMCVLYYISLYHSKPEPPVDLTRRAAVLSYIENELAESLKHDKGMGCGMPILDPFSEEITKIDKETSEIECVGKDWVKCYHSKCRLVEEIKEAIEDITCEYRDILYQNDWTLFIGPVRVSEDGSYELVASDHAKVECRGIGIFDKKKMKWSGCVLGFRATVQPKDTPSGREGSLNMLIFGFDSTSRNSFIRHMPKSWKVLTEDLGATVMEGYNIVGDATAGALFPIFTGKTELELPDVRKSSLNGQTLDNFPFIFYKLKEDGYRTAYFEDQPTDGTFQRRFNGFRNQPTDHYLRAFYLEEEASNRVWKRKKGGKYCVGDTPQFKLMINITEQFMALQGKRFVFTLISDITHGNSMLHAADEDTAAFLQAFHRYREDTLLVFMSDHGSRFSKVRDTLQGKLEERLPLMAIVLPLKLIRERPDAETALRGNARVLTTPHDLHATLLDVLGMTEHANEYRVHGADLKRGLSMLEPIPRNRSCSEAGVEPHWCACVAWQNVSTSDPLYEKAATALLNFINDLLKEVGYVARMESWKSFFDHISKCVPRTLKSTEWVLRQRPNSRLLTFVEARDTDGYVGRFGVQTVLPRENYQVKILSDPGRALFEGTLTYVANEDRFLVHIGDISRTNAYGHEPLCIAESHPHLNSFCYCKS